MHVWAAISPGVCLSVESNGEAQIYSRGLMPTLVLWCFYYTSKFFTINWWTRSFIRLISARLLEGGPNFHSSLPLVPFYTTRCVVPIGHRSSRGSHPGVFNVCCFLIPPKTNVTIFMKLSIYQSSITLEHDVIFGTNTKCSFTFLVKPTLTVILLLLFKGKFMIQLRS